MGWMIWMQQPQEYMVLEIRAPREPVFALPVYAQFIVRQTLTVSTASPITALALPLYIPEPEAQLVLTLRQNGIPVARWRPSLHNSGIQTERLAFDQPRSLQGLLELEINGQAISPQHAEQAPRVFVESDNQAYSDGNYRIAANEKQGDVGLSLFATTTRWQQWLAAWHSQPLFQAGMVGYWLLLLWLILALPYTFTEATKAGK